MKISYNWLKQYLDTDLPADEAAGLLTNCGLEVEGMEVFQSVKGGLEGLVIGEVKTCVRHPNADKLSLTTVDTGNGALLNIVCGAPNVAAGQKVVVALVGAKLFPSEGEPFEIKKSKIRGELSEGMICAEDEIGLGQSHEGVMVLPAETRVGMKAKEYFKVEEDTVFEIGLTPNRADAASHFGVARDLYAVLAVHHPDRIPASGLSLPKTDSFSAGSRSLEIPVEVQDSNACPRYSGVTVTGVEVKESPAWLKNRLLSIGVNPINNIVDITNYVLHECGQPLHAFDADEIKGKKIVVRPAKAEEKFVTLDGVERKLNVTDLMICNEEEPMCIAGVFGGIHSGISEKTKSVFIESACFNPASVRKTSKLHGLKTDASFRFERGTDQEITLFALKRAALLICEIAGGKVSSEIVDVYPEHFTRKNIRYDYNRTSQLIGKKLEETELKKILAALNIDFTSGDDSGIDVQIPSWKVDVFREADVVEEVLRIYGYNRVEVPKKVSASLSYFSGDNREELQDKVSGYLVANGYYEMLNNSLTREEYGEMPGMENPVKVLNPLSRDLGMMRQSLLFGGLETIAYNRNRQHPDMMLFEFGTIYHQTEKGFREEERLSLFLTGKRSGASRKGQPEQTDFFYLKSFVEHVLGSAGLDPESMKEEMAEGPVFSYGLTWQKNEKVIASFGSLSKQLLRQADVAAGVLFADINWTALRKAYAGIKIRYRELPKFPQVKRDLSMILPVEVTYRQIRDLAYHTERNLLKDVRLFDVYAGDKMEAGKKSYAVSFILQDERQTLTDKTIDKVVGRLMEAFERDLKAVIRK